MSKGEVLEGQLEFTAKRLRRFYPKNGTKLFEEEGMRKDSVTKATTGDS
jgi:hypothetical protein